MYLCWRHSRLFLKTVSSNSPFLWTYISAYVVKRVCRYQWPPFSALPGIWLAPFFQQKVYAWPDFSGFLCERPHFSDILVYARICFEAACSLGIQWIDCDIFLTTSNKWVQKPKGSIWIGQHFGWSSIWWVRFFNARYMNGVGFEILARTPVPQLPQVTAPPTPPPPNTHTHTHDKT